MTTSEDVQFCIDEVNAAAAEQVARLRVLAALVKSLPSYHSVTFTNGESISTNLFHGKGDAVEQQIARLVPSVAKWH